MVYQVGRSLGARSPEEARSLAAEDSRIQIVEQVVGIDLGMRSISLSGPDAEVMRKKVIVLSQRVHLKSTQHRVHVEPSPLAEGRFDGYVLMSFDKVEVEQEGARIRSLPVPDIDQDLRDGTENLALLTQQPRQPFQEASRMTGDGEQLVKYRLGGIIAFDGGYAGNSLSKLDNSGFAGGTHAWFSWTPRWAVTFRLMFTPAAKDDSQGIRTDLHATPNHPIGTLLEGGIQYFLEDPRQNAAPWFISPVVYRRTTPVVVRVSRIYADNVVEVGSHCEWGVGALGGIETRTDNPRKGGINFRIYGGAYRSVVSTDAAGMTFIMGGSIGIEGGW